MFHPDKNMKRRTFTQTSALLAGSSVIPLSACANKAQTKTPSSSKYKMGYQLFSVNDDMNKAPLGTLKELKTMGYEDFEIYGFDPQAISYYGLPAGQFKEQLDEMELSVTSGHYRFSDYMEASESDFRKFVDACIQGAKHLNAPYITWPWLDPKYRNMEGYRRMIAKINPIGQQIKDAGLGFAYHNHGFEYDDHDGDNCYDMIMAETDPDLVKLQMDMYWVMHAGTTTPIELVKRQPGRFVMWHIKDMDANTRDYSELGYGAINYLNVLPDPEESGLEYYYIEQGGNFATSAIESARASAGYLQENLKHLL